MRGSRQVDIIQFITVSRQSRRWMLLTTVTGSNDQLEAASWLLATADWYATSISAAQANRFSFGQQLFSSICDPDATLHFKVEPISTER